MDATVITSKVCQQPLWIAMAVSYGAARLWMTMKSPYSLFCAIPSTSLFCVLTSCKKRKSERKMFHAVST